MKRTATALFVVSALAALTVACGDNPDTLSNTSADSTGTIAGDDKKDDEQKPADKTDAKPATSSSATTNAPAPKTTSSSTAACDPKAAKTAAECTKCCAEQASPATTKAANDCACGTSSKCAKECGDNVCKGGFPDLACGACLLQAKCDFGDLGGALGGLAGGNGGTDASACFKTCEDKP